MDIEHCLIVQMDAEFARFEQAADKTLTQRLLYVLSPAREPVSMSVTLKTSPIAGFGRLTVQK